MESNSEREDSQGQMLSGDEQFEQWSKEHLGLQRQIEEIEKRPYVTQADELEEQRLKKLKLQLKDQMSEMVSDQRKA